MCTVRLFNYEILDRFTISDQLDQLAQINAGALNLCLKFLVFYLGRKNSWPRELCVRLDTASLPGAPSHSITEQVL
jgi:hypothetical protein